MLRATKAVKDYAVAAFGFPLLAAMCFLWGVASAVLLVVLPAGTGRRAGRVGAMLGFRSYLAIMQALGGLRLDLRALDSLRGGPRRSGEGNRARAGRGAIRRPMIAR